MTVEIEYPVSKQSDPSLSHANISLVLRHRNGEHGSRSSFSLIYYLFFRHCEPRYLMFRYQMPKIETSDGQAFYVTATLIALRSSLLRAIAPICTTTTKMCFDLLRMQRKKVMGTCPCLRHTSNQREPHSLLSPTMSTGYSE